MAQCSRCKDIFTVWGLVKRNTVYIEPQSRIRTRDNETTINSSDLLSLRKKAYHHCGGELNFFPGYRIVVDSPSPISKKVRGKARTQGG